MNIFASVIIPVYDASKSLKLVLEGYRWQSCKNFELIIADDGSPPEMKAIVKEFAKTAPFEVKYLWQEDKGFRKAKAANEGVKISRGDWLIFSDGDCIPHRDFVKVHIKSARPNSICAGWGVYIPLRYSQKMTAELVAKGYHEKFMPLHRLFRYKFRALREKIFRIKHFPYNLTMGANTSCNRHNFYSVNGFDENYDGFTGEDGDLGKRLLLNGASYIPLWHCCFVFELHKATDKSRLTHPNRDKVRRQVYITRPHISIRCENGLAKEGNYTKLTNYDPPIIGF